MAKYIVKKSGPLKGEVAISGAKNAVLPLMAATLLEIKCRMLLPKVSRWGITLSLAVAAAIDKTGETDEEKEDRVTCSAGR